MNKTHIGMIFLAISLLWLTLSASRLAAEELKFEAELSGAQEVTTPPAGVETPATGSIEIEFDKALTQAQLSLTVRNGTGITQAHFHCASAGENGSVVAFLFGPADPPVDVSEGSVDVTLVNSNIIPFETPDDHTADTCGVPLNNIASLAFAMRAGKIYVNVHSAEFPAGVIRGQIMQADDDDDGFLGF
ncbi:CHRD domain-containing protein [Nitrosomonas sp. Nm51]|uniref:CHRD domain-containing protein n=1 Tax=Nitrosomonas sp. Nm51 TaxID=133720 RepID=UPI0008D3B667|nr:CHRD domain-containing protein [Nitrosomonas sp. Nm51]SER30316.1 CHRD domain-containing protein [Nitrosomonas sp. Nm51]